MAEATLTEYVAPQTTSEVLHLNVGGEPVATLKATLEAAGGILATIVTDPQLWPRDARGRIFLDRDPEHFLTLLNWLRNRDLTFPHRIDGAMAREMRFFGLVPDLLYDKRVGFRVLVNGELVLIEDMTLFRVKLRGAWYPHSVYDGEKCRI
jgi:hypothetical protein